MKTQRVYSDGHQLRFSSVDESDEGLYCCKPALSMLTSTCATATIFNLSIALPPTVTTLQNYISAEIGISSSVVLECSIDFFGKPPASTFTWQRLGKNMLDSAKYSSKVFGNNFDLIIRNVTEEDIGIYYCVIGNPDKYLMAKKSVILSQATSAKNGKRKINYIFIDLMR